MRSQVVIIGGGPAGAAAAARCRQLGLSVTIIEKETFPRYHLGESMIPNCFEPLDKIGFNASLAASGFTEKHSVQFVSQNGSQSKPFYFDTVLSPQKARTWQVTRSRFDTLLLEHAQGLGAEVLQPAQVSKLIEDGDRVVGVEVKQDDKNFMIQSDWVIDASGRDGFSMARLGWRVREQALKKMVLWTYYKGAKRDPGRDEGATTVAYLPEGGWFWYIPLENDVVSVGIVADRDYLKRPGQSNEEIFESEIDNNAWIQDHLSTGKRIENVQVTGDFSYRAKHIAKEGLVLCGDAFAFLDPVFSSGLFLALYSGVECAEAVHSAVEAESYCASQFDTYAKDFCSALEGMRKLVFAFYDQGFNFGKFIREFPHLEEDLTMCLIGAVDRDFGPLFDAMRQMANIPEDSSLGQPLVSVGR